MVIGARDVPGCPPETANLRIPQVSLLSRRAAYSLDTAPLEQVSPGATHLDNLRMPLWMLLTGKLDPPYAKTSHHSHGRPKQPINIANLKSLKRCVTYPCSVCTSWMNLFLFSSPFLILIMLGYNGILLPAVWLSRGEVPIHPRR